MTTQFFNAEHMNQIAQFYSGLQDLIKQTNLDPMGDKGDLYVNRVDIVVRHADQYNIGQFKMEDGMVIFDLDVPEEDAPEAAA